MLKNIQIKIVLIFMILGMAILAFLGISFASQLNDISSSLSGVENVSQIIELQLEKTKILTLTSIGVFGVISAIIGAFILKSIIAPMTKLIKHAELIAGNEKTGEKYLSEDKNEVTGITKAFGMIHDELQENLKEVSRQKKQIETILLHMTDGIIAFNIKGEIIHINVAAKELLEISDSEDNDEFSEVKVPQGTYFMMGDNRDRSDDSRVNVGFVPEENLVGKARFLFFSHNDEDAWYKPWTWPKKIRWSRLFNSIH